MNQEIFDVAKQMFRFSRLHNCGNPQCCIKLMLDNLDVEKKGESTNLTKDNTIVNLVDSNG